MISTLGLAEAEAAAIPAAATNAIAILAPSSR